MSYAKTVEHCCMTAQMMAVSAVMGTKVNFLRGSHPEKHAQIHLKTDPSYLADLATIHFFSAKTTYHKTKMWRCSNKHQVGSTKPKDRRKIAARRIWKRNIQKEIGRGSNPSTLANTKTAVVWYTDVHMFISKSILIRCGRPNPMIQSPIWDGFQCFLHAERLILSSDPSILSAGYAVLWETWHSKRNHKHMIGLRKMYTHTHIGLIGSFTIF